MNEHILIVDDNAEIGDLMKDMLEMEGYRATVRSTGMDTVFFIKSLQPDLILLDITLDAGIDGREICREVKASHEINHIPIIMVSAKHDLQDAMRGYCLPNDLIKKPFDMDDLITAVENQLQDRSHDSY